MSLASPVRRAPRSGIEHEEEKVWIAFYRQVRGDAILAADIVTQLDREPQVKRERMGLYLASKRCLQLHKRRQARNQHLALSIRNGLAQSVAVAFVRMPKALTAIVHAMLDGLAALLPEQRREPAIRKAAQLAKQDEFAAKKASFTEMASTTAPPATTPDAQATTTLDDRKAG